MTRAGQLDQISEAIGAMRADVKHVHECIHDVKTKVEQLDTGFQDLQRLRAKGGGILIGVAIASGFVGSKLAWLGHIAGKLTGN
jgi:hypothetical protein